MKNGIKNITVCHILFLANLLSANLKASLPVDDAMLNAKLNVMNLVEDNNYLLQSIIVLLVVMIFGYTGKLYYEKKIKKE